MYTHIIFTGTRVDTRSEPGTSVDLYGTVSLMCISKDHEFHDQLVPMIVSRAKDHQHGNKGVDMMPFSQAVRDFCNERNTTI